MEWRDVGEFVDRNLDTWVQWAQVVATFGVILTFVMLIRQLRMLERQLTHAETQAQAAREQAIYAGQQVDYGQKQLEHATKTLEQSAKAALGQNTIALVQYLQGAENRDARGELLGRIRDEDRPYAHWSDADRKIASTVCASYDLAGILLDQELVDPDVILKTWGSSIRRSYALTAAHRLAMREANDGNYWRGFDYLHDEVKALPTP